VSFSYLNQVNSVDIDLNVVPDDVDIPSVPDVNADKISSRFNGIDLNVVPDEVEDENELLQDVPQDAWQYLLEESFDDQMNLDPTSLEKPV